MGPQWKAVCTKLTKPFVTKLIISFSLHSSASRAVLVLPRQLVGADSADALASRQPFLPPEHTPTDMNMLVGAFDFPFDIIM